MYKGKWKKRKKKQAEQPTKPIWQHYFIASASVPTSRFLQCIPALTSLHDRLELGHDLK